MRPNLFVIACLLAAFNQAYGGSDLQRYPDYTKHECVRDCTTSTSAMFCRYDFTTEMMYSMNKQCGKCLKGNDTHCFNEQCIVTDGQQVVLKVANRQFPGPPIQVCLGDTIEVAIDNMLEGETTTIHWHGIFQQDNNLMDGVPFVTQCPILANNIFVYRFDATQCGTYLYHSHVDQQHTIGLSGPITVRCANDPHLQRYDFDLPEHTIMIQDWVLFSQPVMVSRYDLLHDAITSNTTGISFNGFASTVGNKVPPMHFTVTQGSSYRFRIIHGGANECPTKFSILNHTMWIIAVDGNDVIPFEVDAFVFTTGERVDFILNANQPPGTYWMKALGDSICGNKTGLAYLDYKGHARRLAKATSKRNPVPNRMLGYFETIPAKEYINYDRVWSYNLIDQRLKVRHADYQFYALTKLTPYAPLQFRGVGGDEMLTSNINNITFKAPHTPLILQDPVYHDPFCNAANRQQFCPNSDRVCNCLHVLDLPPDSVIELMLLNVREQHDFYESHPMHLHGHSFSVLAIGKTNATTLDQLRYMDRMGMLRRNYGDVAMKDTIALPNYGYAILRFYTNNPGYWTFHCHVNFHVFQGMVMAFKVGEFNNIPANFPRCGDFI